MLRKELPRRKQRERSRAAGSTATPAIELSPAELPLFDALRELRTRLAREQSVPPYVIFHDTTLRGITRQRPSTLDELAQVGGIGGTKLARYGEQVLEAIAAAATDSKIGRACKVRRRLRKGIAGETARNEPCFKPSPTDGKAGGWAKG